MQKAPQRLKLKKDTEYVLPTPILYDPENYAFAGWADEASGRIYQIGDRYTSDRDTILVARWHNALVYPKVCSLSVAKYCDGFFRHIPTALLTYGSEDGTECVKIVPTPDAPTESTVILDGYHYSDARINLGVYRYAVLIMKYDGGNGDEYIPMLTFPKNSHGIQQYSVEVNADRCTEKGRWNIYTFDLAGVSASLVDMDNATMRQMYIHPYGNKAATDIPLGNAVYVAKLIFCKEKPDIKICTARLSECFADIPEAARDLSLAGASADFEDTDIVYITEGGKYESILTDISGLCNKNLIPDTDAGARFMSELDERTKARIEQIRSTETTVTVTGTKYYVSTDGNDENDGLSPLSAWKTAQRVNQAELKFGDGVFFRRGDIWHDVAINAKEGVTYSAYGESGNGVIDAKPRLYGSPENGADASKWSLHYEEKGKKIWVYHREMSDVGLMVFNDGEEYTTKAIPSYINERFVLRDEPQTDFDMTKHLDDMMLFSEIIPAGAWVSRRAGRLYLRCDRGNPGEIYNSIEFNTRSTIIELGAKSNVTVDNLCLMYTGSIAIHAWDASENPARAIENLTVTNCEIGWIGGGIQKYNIGGANNGKVIRFGNGVEIYGGCDGYTIDNCYIYQCYDAGFTVQCGNGAVSSVGTMKNVTFSNTVTDYCNYGMEIWNGSSTELDGRVGENIFVTDNIIRHSGYGFGYQRYNKETSAAIMGFRHENIFRNYRITGNVFARGLYTLLNTTSEYSGTLPIYDGNTYVQETGAHLGFVGLGFGTLYTFDMTAKSTVENILGDKNAKIYYLKKDI